MAEHPQSCSSGGDSGLKAGQEFLVLASGTSDNKGTGIRQFRKDLQHRVDKDIGAFFGSNAADCCEPDVAAVA